MNFLTALRGGGKPRSWDSRHSLGDLPLRFHESSPCGLSGGLSGSDSPSARDRSAPSDGRTTLRLTRCRARRQTSLQKSTLKCKAGDLANTIRSRICVSMLYVVSFRDFCKPSSKAVFSRPTDDPLDFEEPHPQQHIYIYI